MTARHSRLLSDYVREWREALHTSLRYQRQDLVDTVVAPAAAAAAAGLLSDARESVERVNKYSARLREVRGKRQAMAAAMAAGTGVCGQFSFSRGEYASVPVHL